MESLKRHRDCRLAVYRHPRTFSRRMRCSSAALSSSIAFANHSVMSYSTLRRRLPAAGAGRAPPGLLGSAKWRQEGPGRGRASGATAASPGRGHRRSPEPSPRGAGSTPGAARGGFGAFVLRREAGMHQLGCSLWRKHWLEADW